VIGLVRTIPSVISVNQTNRRHWDPLFRLKRRIRSRNAPSVVVLLPSLQTEQEFVQVRCSSKSGVAQVAIASRGVKAETPTAANIKNARVVLVTFITDISRSYPGKVAYYFLGIFRGEMNPKKTPKKTSNNLFHLPITLIEFAREPIRRVFWEDDPWLTG